MSDGLTQGKGCLEEERLDKGKEDNFESEVVETEWVSRAAQFLDPWNNDNPSRPSDVGSRDQAGESAKVHPSLLRRVCETVLCGSVGAVLVPLWFLVARFDHPRCDIPVRWLFSWQGWREAFYRLTTGATITLSELDALKDYLRIPLDERMKEEHCMLAKAKNDAWRRGQTVSFIATEEKE